MINTVIEAIAAKKEVSGDTIHSSDVIEELDLDSLDIIDLIFDVETALDVRLPQDLRSADYAELVTVADLAELLERNVRGKS